MPTPAPNLLHIDANAFQQDFAALAQIGATGDGGVHRPALFETDLQARAWLADVAARDGFMLHQDGAGNQFVAWEVATPGRRTLLVGSHLDSVPYGGRFDGPLGVTAALAVLRALREAALALPFRVCVVNFTDEEGTLVGVLGSRALAGALSAEMLATPRGGRERLEQAYARSGLTDASVLGAAQDPAHFAGYLELHIEQGTRLERGGLALGIVTEIVGVRSFRVVFTGQAAHAGTQPMDDRRDALWGAADFVLRARRRVLERFAPGVVNVGDVRVAPGAYNIVPAEAVASVECRHSDPTSFDALQEMLLGEASAVAATWSLGVEVIAVGSIPPAAMDRHFVRAAETAAGRLGLAHTRLLSYAIHDPQFLSAIMPTVMLFVPSAGGTSHTPHEFTPWDDCVRGANALLHTVLVLAGH